MPRAGHPCEEDRDYLIMKMCCVSLVGAAVLLSACQVAVRPYGAGFTVVPFQPFAPPELVQSGPIPVHAPQDYVWDGYEYVGLYGDQYVYWNSGAWDVCGAVMLARFHGWEGYHPAWRSHAVSYYHGRRPYR